MNYINIDSKLSYSKQQLFLHMRTIVSAGEFVTSSIWLSQYEMYSDYRNFSRQFSTKKILSWHTESGARLQDI